MGDTTQVTKHSRMPWCIASSADSETHPRTDSMPKDKEGDNYKGRQWTRKIQSYDRRAGKNCGAFFFLRAEDALDHAKDVFELYKLAQEFNDLLDDELNSYAQSGQHRKQLSLWANRIFLFFYFFYFSEKGDMCYRNKN